MNSRSHSSNKAKKQMFKAKTVISLQITAHWKRVVTRVHRDWATDPTKNCFKKTKHNNIIMFLKANNIKNHNRLKFSIKCDELSYLTSRSQLDLLTEDKVTTPQINNKDTKKPELQTILRDHTVQGTIIIRYYLQEL